MSLNVDRAELTGEKSGSTWRFIENAGHEIDGVADGTLMLPVLTRGTLVAAHAENGLTLCVVTAWTTKRFTNPEAAPVTSFKDATDDGAGAVSKAGRSTGGMSERRDLENTKGLGGPRGLP